MKKYALILQLCISFSVFPNGAQSQTAPPHLKYFGFTAIDCFYDDPLDGSSVTNYLSEVDTFSNLAHLCVYDYTDDVTARTEAMNARCVLPLMHIQNVFFQYVDTLAPSGANYDLWPDFTARWASFASANASVLTPDKTGCFYIADEPFWNGISLAEMDTVCALIQASFPAIPLLMVEAYTTVGTMEVPAAMDWVGFDMYGIFDPQTDPGFLAYYDTLKMKLSSPHQRVMLIIDDQWFPAYQTFLGWPQDTMANVVQNYYDLATSDTMVNGLIGYIWPGGLDAPDHHGVRNMVPSMIAKNVEIGTKIKANFLPCVSGVRADTDSLETIRIFPNPAHQFIKVELPDGLQKANFRLFFSSGKKALDVNVNHSGICIDTGSLPAGLYLYTVESGGRRFSGKLILN